MQCESLKCKKNIANAYPCNKCTSKFCSNSCMIDHFFDAHQNSNEEIKISSAYNSNKGGANVSPISLANMKKNKGKNSVTSAFIKPGDFLKEIKLDPYFTFSNFEKVKMGKKTHVLGAGAFGDVYLVKHKVDGKFFAIKQMEKEKILQTGAKLDVVRREIDIHCRLIHENIIRLYSYHEDEISFYLILEYANSGTLFNAIRKSKGLDEKRAFKYFIQTSAAVHFIHENNLIHRDLKPENLLLDENDNIKLCDFGWCIELEIGNRTTFCGTIEYMAPEIIKEMPYDRSIDVWSLGVLLYEMLHGYSPFRANSENEEEEHSQIFKNIIKYKFTIDKKELSTNCKDLIIKLLTPQNTQRLKTKDIFSHPWVMDFEPLFENKSKSDNKLTKIEVEKVEKIEQIEKIEKVEEEIKKEIQKKDSIKNVKLEEHREKIKENLQLQKLNSVQLAMNSTQDFSYYDNDKADSLFDKVLTQVKEKNKDKRKKSKLIDDDGMEAIEKILEKENKIVLKVQREERQKSTDRVQKDERKVPKSDFKMLKEINEMEKDLNKHINDNNRMHDELKMKKDELGRAMMENSKSALNKKSSVRIEENENYEDEYNNTTINANNSKKTSAHSNNLVNLYPKTYINKFQEDEDSINKSKKNPNNISDLNIKRDKKKNTVELKGENYNDILYMNSNRGRESHKAKNSISGKPKDLNKELDLGFLPKDLLYNDKTFEDSNKNILSALDLLEKAQENKKEVDNDSKEAKTFWDKFSTFMNPFKCGG